MLLEGELHGAIHGRGRPRKCVAASDRQASRIQCSKLGGAEGTKIGILGKPSRHREEKALNAASDHPSLGEEGISCDEGMVTYL
jgi:hypothetical protein